MAPAATEEESVTAAELSQSSSDALFESVAKTCERLLEGKADDSFIDVPQRLREIFDLDHERYVRETRAGASARNVTCMRPKNEDEYFEQPHIRGDGLMDVELEPGRVCRDGCCTGECSRVVLPSFATDSECELLCRFAADLMPMPDPEAGPSEGCFVEDTQANLAMCAAAGQARRMLTVCRVVERLRRAVAHEYGLTLASLAPHSSFLSQWVSPLLVGESGCGWGTPVHGDEAACDGFHYSTIIHLSSKGDGFEGGDFCFSDAATVAAAAAAARAPLADAVTEIGPAAGSAEAVADAARSDVARKSTTDRLLTRLEPQRGRAMVFTSGWENLHFVDEITSGVRYAMPAFFVTRGAWAAEGPEDMRGPVGRSEAAGALLEHVLSADHAEDRGQFTLLWHSLFAAPLEDDGGEEGGFGGRDDAGMPKPGWEERSVVLNTGASMPALGYGTYRLEGEPLRRALVCALQQGYRHIDTAAGYENEAVVAAAIAESGVPREEIFLTSKLWCTDHGTEATYDAILASLAALSTDYIDLYLIHAPTNLGETDEEIRGLRQQSWQVMEALHAAGTLRSIGVSNFEPRHIEQLLRGTGGSRREGAVLPAVNQVELHAYLSQSDIREYCEAQGILVTSYGSVGAASGLLDDPTVVAIAKSHGKSAAQVTLRHSLQRNCAVLARSTAPQRIAANVELFDFELSEEEVQQLDALERAQRTYWDNSEVP